jgi:transcriptional regulator with XRE-family HTH domain
MMELQTWMDRHGKRDHQVAAAISISRPQVSRIRRGLTTASPDTAHKLEALTGIKWFHFLERTAENVGSRGVVKARASRKSKRRLKKAVQ